MVTHPVILAVLVVFPSRYTVTSAASYFVYHAFSSAVPRNSSSDAAVRKQLFTITDFKRRYRTTMATNFLGRTASERSEESFKLARSASQLLPTTNYQLPTTNYQLPTTNYQLPTTNYKQQTTNNQRTDNTAFPCAEKNSPKGGNTTKRDTHPQLVRRI